MSVAFCVLDSGCAFGPDSARTPPRLAARIPGVSVVDSCGEAGDNAQAQCVGSLMDPLDEPEREQQTGNSLAPSERLSTAAEATVIEPTRLRGFARYFKDYMGAWSIVVAALPIPVTAFKLIPTFQQYRLPLSVYTPLFCFLLLGFVFFIRHQLAPLMFRRRENGALGVGQLALAPVFLIMGSFAAIISYHAVLQQSLGKLAAPGIASSIALDRTDLKDIPDGSLLISLYLAFFLTAEGAFILMATKEYLQDEIGISEKDLYSFILTSRPSLCTVRFTCWLPSMQIASVSVDGNYIGTTPCRADLQTGEHTVLATAVGYRDWLKSITIRPGDRDLSYEIKLDI
jgi:hypothetical protein